MRYFYVTVHCTNGAIESIEIPLEEDLVPSYDTFKQKMKEYDDMCMDYNQQNLFSLGHIISWSEIEKE